MPKSAPQAKLVNDISWSLPTPKRCCWPPPTRRVTASPNCVPVSRIACWPHRFALEAAEAVLLEKTRAAARATDDFVHENPGKPWASARVYWVLCWASCWDGVERHPHAR